MMEDQYKEEEKKESLLEKIADKIYDSSSSDSDDVKITTSLKDKVSNLFSREKKTVHKLLGGGKPADVFLWRNKKFSAGFLSGATAIWVLFDVLQYHLLTLLCHVFILGLAILFVWSNAAAFINKSPPRIPVVCIPEDPVLKFVSDLRKNINCGFATLKDIASGKELKKFLSVIVGLWVLSVLGSCTDFLTLLYTITVALFTLPLLYETYEHHVDSFAEKTLAELKNQYAVFDEKVLSKIPRGTLRAKKRD